MPTIDVIEWRPGSERPGSDKRRTIPAEIDGSPVYAARFPETNLSTLSQLIVAESQEAVLFSKGRLVGKFGPGKHTLNTENLPMLRGLFGLPFGGKNPFTSEVWFVKKLLPLNIDWRTDAMMHHDPDYQTMVPIVAAGRYGLRVDDAERFLLKLVGTAPFFTAQQLTKHFWGALVAMTKTVLLQYMQSQRVGIKSVSAYLAPLSKTLETAMIPFWEDYGFGLIGFYVTSVEIDGDSPAGQRILEAMSQQSAQVIAGYSWQQSQVFGAANNAIDSMSKTGGGGLLGAVMMSGMLGGTSMQAVLQPPNAPALPGTNTPVASGAAAAPAPRVVFCSNCARKYSSDMQYCPHCGDPYMPCPRCGTDNDARAARCVSCGATLAAIDLCGRCGNPLPHGASFCPRCSGPAMLAAACSRCGTQLPGNAAFCAKCGLKAD
jgi:membrane protease subunit (stomatin/prohibitin family)